MHQMRSPKHLHRQRSMLLPLKQWTRLRCSVQKLTSMLSHLGQLAVCQNRRCPPELWTGRAPSTLMQVRLWRAQPYACAVALLASASAFSFCIAVKAPQQGCQISHMVQAVSKHARIIVGGILRMIDQASAESSSHSGQPFSFHMILPVCLPTTVHVILSILPACLLLY